MKVIYKGDKKKMDLKISRNYRQYIRSPKAKPSHGVMLRCDVMESVTLLCLLEGPEGGMGVPLGSMLNVIRPSSNERWPEAPVLMLFTWPMRPLGNEAAGSGSAGGGGGILYLEPLHVERAMHKNKRRRRRGFRAIWMSTLLFLCFSPSLSLFINVLRVKERGRVPFPFEDFWGVWKSWIMT